MMQKEYVQINLVMLRKRRGLKIKELAEALGVTAKTVSAWENNHNTPKGERLRKLSDFYGVSADDIINCPPDELEIKLFEKEQFESLSCDYIVKENDGNEIIIERKIYAERERLVLLDHFRNILTEKYFKELKLLKNEIDELLYKDEDDEEDSIIMPKDRVLFKMAKERLGYYLKKTTNENAENYDYEKKYACDDNYPLLNSLLGEETAEYSINNDKGRDPDREKEIIGYYCRKLNIKQNSIE